EILAALGDHDLAMARLESAAEEHATDLMWIGVRPAFAGLRQHARFRQLAARIGVPPGSTTRNSG
ncbi:MAG: hypothetical protein ABI120_17920, partial [Gemmatimonadaceae bacterium]